MGLRIDYGRAPERRADHRVRHDRTTQGPWALRPPCTRAATEHPRSAASARILGEPPPRDNAIGRSLLESTGGPRSITADLRPQPAGHSDASSWRLHHLASAHPRLDPDRRVVQPHRVCAQRHQVVDRHVLEGWRNARRRGARSRQDRNCSRSPEGTMSASR